MYPNLFAAFFLNSKFKDLFQSSCPTFEDDFSFLIEERVTPDQNEDLIRIPSPEEVRKAAWDMHPLKAPGPDGMSGCFFKNHWDIVGHQVVSFVQEFFSTGKFVSEVNKTFICLIPKKAGADTFDQLRPISLCNWVYKLVSKILVLRLCPILRGLITPFQAAFVPGRWIAESSVLAHETIQQIRKKKGKGGLLAMKIDMSKAYDRIEWSFLERVLVLNGFHPHFIKIIMHCVSTVSYQVLLNGSPLRAFKPKRGLRQGDPLSPYLFILCSDVLSRLLIKREQEGKIHGIKIATNAPAVSHLMFADDTLLFCRAKESEVEEINRCLDSYCKWSGQALNRGKSSLLFSKNSDHETQRRIKAIAQMPEMSNNAKYLGNPLILSKNRINDFAFLKEKVCGRIESWQSKYLSRAGRTTLIRAVISSVPIYTMSSFLIPKKLCKELDSIASKFWWKGNSGSEIYMALTSWKSLCQPKAS